MGHIRRFGGLGFQTFLAQRLVWKTRSHVGFGGSLPFSRDFSPDLTDLILVFHGKSSLSITLLASMIVVETDNDKDYTGNSN